MKILVAGGKGQLGSDLVRIASARGYETIAPARDELDITVSNTLSVQLQRFIPDIVINCAAYTAVDKAESEPDAAFLVNRDGVANLARACAEAKLPLIHLSTDYVFDGEQSTPYREDDAVSPLGIYGQSKWAGEEAVREYCSEHLIVRIAWVFGVFGHNFVKTMQRLAREREELCVVNDQHGCPTATRAVSRCLLSMVEKVLQNGGPWGTYHYVCQPATTWHGFACEIIEQTSELEELMVRQIHAIATEDFPTPAKRPKNSVLNCDKIRRDFGVEQADWREELIEVIDEIHRQNIK